MADRLRKLAAFFGIVGFALWIVSCFARDGRGPEGRELFVYPLVAGAGLLALLSIAWRKQGGGP